MPDLCSWTLFVSFYNSCKILISHWFLKWFTNSFLTHFLQFKNIWILSFLIVIILWCRHFPFAIKFCKHRVSFKSRNLSIQITTDKNLLTQNTLPCKGGQLWTTPSCLSIVVAMTILQSASVPGETELNRKRRENEKTEGWEINRRWRIEEYDSWYGARPSFRVDEARWQMHNGRIF